MTWCATNEGAHVTSITFKVATALIDDGEGGIASDVGQIVIPVRLAPINRLGDIAGVNEMVFPGSATYRYVFYGWINDPSNYTFPDVLRNQGRVEGTCSLQGVAGRIECAVSAFPIKEAAEMIGEKFTAGWVAA